MRPTIFRLAALAATTRITPPATSCPCGYAITAAHSEYRPVFTEAIESDFLHTTNLTTDAVWIPQAYNVTPSAARGPYGKSSRVENVHPNPISNPHHWTGAGIHGGDPGLQLWVNHDLIPSPTNSTDQMVPMSEIASSRSDILHGSFRIAMKTTPLPGTCAAFFFYLSDSSEIDMEFLSEQPLPRPGQASLDGTVNLVLHSPESAAVGYVDPDSPDFMLQGLAFNPHEGYHEYRFDWLPGRVDFYADGTLLRTMRDNVPTEAGAVHLSHWSNGNSGWSGGPPGEDAVMVVSYVKAYFNSSRDAAAATSLGQCEGGEVCQVPDQREAPEPSGREGNRTGHTTFFGNESTIQGTVNEPKQGGGSGLVVRHVVVHGLFTVAVSLFLGLS